MRWRLSTKIPVKTMVSDSLAGQSVLPSYYLWLDSRSYDYLLRGALRLKAIPIRKLEKHQTQRAAERAAEAELNRRGISTAKTDGNLPGIDLVAIHSDGRLTPIEVKGQQGKGKYDWFIA
jgi:hypothetical protein